ncbi:tRNA (guanine-N1)-methyltransferase [Patiriisocius hiemis]|uniref:tRNA (Guanine-N1)-methyltransferase n=1 Tax=Patiriisocius hiemis TaxID=3075604 RepID=A0ABU2YAX7_9FLAO|nr:tRNA (guanine-N1)-methyltransferase [Constantimarinum sp. W242]MDT0554395.1 tRNA (guanine-N1)-methyltransferase [Constantimarinum sp. W242]
MKKLILLALLLFCSVSLSYSQETETKDNSLNGQFEAIKKTSNNYQDYEVVKKFKLNALQKNTLDSIAVYKSEISTLKNTISSQNDEISSLTTTLNETKVALTNSQEKEDGIEFLGILTQKSTYNTILWSIIGLLLITLAYFIYRFNASNSITKESKAKLTELESEFELHRQKKLEEMQQVRRKLQDEINKNRKA